MCQLTVIDINNLLLEKLFSHYLPMINADKGNRDGFGCVVGNKMWKTIAQPTGFTLEHLHLTKDIVKPEPILLHVRSASFGIKVTTENVHPFRFGNLIGMHNGTLYFPDEHPTYVRTSEESRESDSKRFFELLNKNYTGKMVVDLQETMKDITGKFAFLIKEIKTKKIYVVRGKSAQLSYTKILDEDGSVIGILVNTDKLCLERSINAVGVIYTLLTGRTLTYISPIDVDEESIFELQGYELVKVGELKENPVVYYTPAKQSSALPVRVIGQPIVYANNDRLNPETKRIIIQFIDYFKQTGMYIDDLDILSNAVFGKVFADLDIEDFRLLNAYVMPQIIVSKNAMKKIVDSFGMIPNRHDIVASGLEFPLGINAIPITLSKLRKYQKEIQAKYSEIKVESR